MTTKLKGAEGIEFPDGSVQGSAAFTKAEMNSQTWQAVTRVYGTTYINDTGRPIKVFIQGITNAANGVIELTVGSRVFRSSAQSANGGWITLGEVTVPAGESYVVSESTGVMANNWLELR